MVVMSDSWSNAGYLEHCKGTPSSAKLLTIIFVNFKTMQNEQEIAFNSTKKFINTMMMKIEGRTQKFIVV